MHYYDLLTMPTMPALSLLLEPRSLVITTREQYTARAHGIDAVVEDRVWVSELANAGMLGSGGTWDVVPSTGAGNGDDSEVMVLRRETRYSLTCRDVERVINVGIGARKVF